MGQKVWLHLSCCNLELLSRKRCSANVSWVKESQASKSAWDLALRYSAWLVVSKEYISMEADLGKTENDANYYTKTGVGPKWSSEFELFAILSIEGLDCDVRHTCAVSLSTFHLDQDLLIISYLWNTWCGSFDVTSSQPRMKSLITNCQVGIFYAWHVLNRSSWFGGEHQLRGTRMQSSTQVAIHTLPSWIKFLACVPQLSNWQLSCIFVTWWNNCEKTFRFPNSIICFDCQHGDPWPAKTHRCVFW